MTPGSSTWMRLPSWSVRPCPESGSSPGVRIFAGYAGWGTEQLEAEIEEGSWYVVPSTPSDVFSTEPESLWARVLRRQPGELAWVSTRPLDPTLN
jgi:putative transcriptional regulator